MPSSHRGDSDGEKYLITISRGLDQGGGGEPWVFLSADPISWNKGGWVMLQVVEGEYFKPADSLQSQISSSDPSSAITIPKFIFLNTILKVGVFISLIKRFLVKENDFESSATQTCSALKYDRVLLATISIGRPGMGAGRQILYFRCKACDFVFQVQK